jgi:lipopolysaccharide/colanic/teichoic acid biosynthesis glycosyltransferase
MGRRPARRCGRTRDSPLRRGVTLGLYSRAGKRIFDFVIGCLLLVMLSPALLATAVLVKIFLGSPVLFRQMRPGYKGKAFTLIKFRSMRVADGEADAARLTVFGRALRSTSIDELPELWNVLKGEMSLVGPRPLLLEYLPLYSAEEARRHDVRPGMTGWAQVNGRNTLSWKDRFQLDVWYVDHLSFLFDLRIIVLTMVRVLRRSGISQEGQATAAPFTGTH